MSFLCSHSDCFLLEDYIGCVSTANEDSNNKKKKHCSWWCANCRENMITGYWWCKQVTEPVKLRCSKRMRCRKVCM